MGWKIVRDNQPGICRENGVSGSWRESPDPVRGLTRKLFEEAAEFAEYFDPGELYDLRDVLNELLVLTDPQGVHGDAHVKKVARSGLFASHLEWHPHPGRDDGSTGHHPACSRSDRCGGRCLGEHPTQDG